MVINILVWLLFGLLAACLAAYFLSSEGEQIASFLVLGIVGALVGGAVGSIVSSTNPGSLNILGIFLALAGSALLITSFAPISYFSVINVTDTRYVINFIFFRHITHYPSALIL